MINVIRSIKFFMSLPKEVIFLIFFATIIFGKVLGSRRERRKRLKGCPVGYLQDEIGEAYRQQREAKTDADREKSHLHSYYKQVIKKLERDNSYLRSKLYR